MGAGPWRVVADVPPVRLARQRGFHTFWRSAHGGVASRVVLGTPLETTPGVLAAHPQARICRSPRRRCWLGHHRCPRAAHRAGTGRHDQLTGFGTAETSLFFTWLAAVPRELRRRRDARRVPKLD
jgi:hypothetical protein